MTRAPVGKGFRLRAAWLSAILLVTCFTIDARAQSPEPRVELTGAVLLAGGANFGTQTATLTANDPGDPGFTLFSTATTLGHGLGAEGRLGVAVTRAIAVEGAFSWTRHTLETRITGDVENGAATAATQSNSTMSIGGDAVVRLTPRGFAGGKGIPFALAGGGYFRQTDDHQVELASGGYVEAGGGVKYVVLERAKGFLRRLALRGDGRFVVRSNAFDPIDARSTRATWAVTAGVSVGL